SLSWMFSAIAAATDIDPSLVEASGVLEVPEAPTPRLDACAFPYPACALPCWLTPSGLPLSDAPLELAVAWERERNSPCASSATPPPLLVRLRISRAVTVSSTMASESEAPIDASPPTASP